MKILVYENSAGFTSYTHKLCNALKSSEQSNEIVYMTQHNNAELKGLSKDIILKDVLDYYDKSGKKSIKWFFNRIIISTKNILKRNKEAKTGNYDVLSLQATIPVIDQFFIKKLKKYTKVVYTVHDVIPPVKSFYYSMPSLAKMYKTVDHIIVHSKKNKEQLIEMFNVEPDKISVVFHGTETSYNFYEQDACREKFGIDKSKTVCLFFGAIREQKGLDILIEAMKGIPDMQLVIAGGMPFGESFDRYDELIKKNNIDCVKYIKFIPEEWSDELFQACDMVCLPYRYFYSQSGVFMQSIQYRKPVVISDVSAFGEYLTKYNMGVLVKPRDISDLHDKLIYMQNIVTKDKNYFSTELERAAKDNSWESSAKLHWEIFGG